jgi:putative methyltransferase (TIGR04325 family)
MRFSRFVKQLITSMSQSVKKDRRQTEFKGNVWEGIYSHYRDVPATGEGFDGEVWVERTAAYTKRILDLSKSHRTVSTEVVNEHLLLPLLVSLICKQAKETVKILDFGGGMGVTFIHLARSLTACPSFKYYVVERERVCEEGSRLLQHDERINFCPELPAELPDLDVVYISSALQYIEDYKSILKALSAYQPKYFLFTKLSAGDFPTYATAQKNVQGSVVAYWFININEVVEIMSEYGYSLLYKSALEQTYDQENFPEEYRMGQTCNLLFSRN